MSALLRTEPLRELVDRQAELVGGRKTLARQIANGSGEASTLLRFFERLDKGEHLKGLQVRTADKVACALGTHPVLLWPEWTDVEEEIVSDSITEAQARIQEELDETEHELSTLDGRKRALKERVKQLRQAAAALAKVSGGPSLVEEHECDQCDFVGRSKQGLAAHKTKTHKAA